MHDVDRTQLESGFGEEYQFELGTDYEYGGSNGSSYEAEEMELAVDLLEVQSDEELEEFLGDLVSKATRAAGDFLRSSTGRAVTNIVKDVARKALPNIGRSIGGIFGQQGGDIGAGLAQRAGSMLGLELEGLSPQDQEFEVARQFVRFARTAVDDAASNADAGPPQVVAQQAVKKAAERYAPGLLRNIGGRGDGGGRRGGYPGTGIVSPQQLQAIIRQRPQVSPLSEVEEMELAADLLGVSNEEELEEFLGDLVKKAASAVGSAIRSPIGRQITGALRGVAKTALPALGAAGAGFFGLPPQLGGAAGSWLANTFELETDGMDREEQEFEIARKIVQLGATATSNAVAAPREAPAKQVAQASLQAAAQRYAPGLARGNGGNGGGRGEGGGRSGRWVRRGRKVVLYGV